MIRELVNVVDKPKKILARVAAIDALEHMFQQLDFTSIDKDHMTEAESNLYLEVCLGYNMIHDT